MIEYPQMALRFVARDGANVLQQAWAIVTTGDEPMVIKVEWRDVPLEENRQI